MSALGVTVELNIADVEEMVRREVERRYPGLVLLGFSISSWSTMLVRVDHGTMTEPTRHHLNPDHRQLPWEDS